MFVRLAGFLSVVLLACARPQSSQASRAPQASASASGEAIVTDTLVQFVFPRDTVAEYRWNEREPSGRQPRAAIYWAVIWAGRLAARPDVDPDQLHLTVFNHAGDTVQRGGLDAAARAAKTGVWTTCSSCGASAGSLYADSAVSARVADRRLILEVVGRDAVRRLFPSGITRVRVFAVKNSNVFVEDTLIVKTPR